MNNLWLPIIEILVLLGFSLPLTRTLLRSIAGVKLGVLGIPLLEDNRQRVRFLLQNQREMPVRGPAEVTLKIEGRGQFVLGEEHTLIHGPGAIAGSPTAEQDPADSSDRSSCKIVRFAIGRGMRPLETWEITSGVSSETSAVSLTICAEKELGREGTLSVRLAKEALESKPRVIGPATNGMLVLLPLAILLTLVVFVTVGWAIRSFTEGATASLLETVYLGLQDPRFLGVLFVQALFVVAAMTVWWRREPAIIQGYRGALGITKTSSWPELSSLESEGNELPDK